MKDKTANADQIEVKRVVSAIDLEHAFQIRRVVFMKEQKVSLEDEFDGFDEVSTHYLASLNSQPAGTARWRHVAEGIKLERFAVLKEFRGKGIARKLVRQVMNDVLVNRGPEERVFLHAQMEVVRYYASEGFVCVGNEFIECDIRHIEMEYKGQVEEMRPN